MKVSIGFRREAGKHPAVINTVGNIFFYDLFQKIQGLFFTHIDYIFRRAKVVKSPVVPRFMVCGLKNPKLQPLRTQTLWRNP
jgi:hypothetical protein